MGMHYYTDIHIFIHTKKLCYMLMVMVMYGYVWLCMVMYGYVWLYMVIYHDRATHQRISSAYISHTCTAVLALV